MARDADTDADATELRRRWQADALAQHLQPLLPGAVVEVLASCTSTNTLLVDRARALGAEPAPTLLVAEEQTQGRGRLGRTWVAAAGASLTFSLALPLAPRDWSGLSLAVGLALAEALAPGPAGMSGPSGIPGIGLKWPNDLWLVDAAHAQGGRKLGGILIETVSVGPVRICVVGVGLNVRPLLPRLGPPHAPTLADSLAGATASLHELDPRANAPEVLALVALPLARALRSFEREGFAPLAARYAERDLLRGQPVRTTLPHAASGVAEGVDAQGALVLRVHGERRERILSGEVSVRRTTNGPEPEPAGGPPPPQRHPGATA